MLSLNYIDYFFAFCIGDSQFSRGEKFKGRLIELVLLRLLLVTGAAWIASIKVEISAFLRISNYFKSFGVN